MKQKKNGQLKYIHKCYSDVILVIVELNFSTVQNFILKCLIDGDWGDPNKREGCEK